MKKIVCASVAAFAINNFFVSVIAILTLISCFLIAVADERERIGH